MAVDAAEEKGTGMAGIVAGYACDDGGGAVGYIFMEIGDTDCEDTAGRCTRPESTGMGVAGIATLVGGAYAPTGVGVGMAGLDKAVGV